MVRFFAWGIAVSIGAWSVGHTTPEDLNPPAVPEVIVQPMLPSAYTDAMTRADERGREVWDAVAQCESGGRWDLNVGKFDGGLQFLPSTWVAAGGLAYAPYAYQATRTEQIDVADHWLARTSWRQWPFCSRRLHLR